MWKKAARVQYRSKDYISIPRYWYYCTYHVANLVHGNLMNHAKANVSSFHLGYISATSDKSNFVSIVVIARSRECRRFHVTEWCVFCAEITSHLYEVFWWRRGIGKSRFFYSVFVIYMCIEIFSLTFSPVTSSRLDGRRKATVFPRIYILSPVWSEQLIRRVVCRPA